MTKNNNEAYVDIRIYVDVPPEKKNQQEAGQEELTRKIDALLEIGLDILDVNTEDMVIREKY